MSNGVPRAFDLSNPTERVQFETAIAAIRIRGPRDIEPIKEGTQEFNEFKLWTEQWFDLDNPEHLQKLDELFPGYIEERKRYVEIFHEGRHYAQKTKEDFEESYLKAGGNPEALPFAEYAPPKRDLMAEYEANLGPCKCPKPPTSDDDDFV